MHPSHFEELQRLTRHLKLLRAPSSQSIPSACEGQFLDRELLKASKLYRRSRSLFREVGGSFIPSVISSERSLSSPTLLTPEIRYTPHREELLYQLASPLSSKLTKALRFKSVQTLLSQSVSLFHEQSHRILATFIPAPRMLTASQIRMSLNLWESLVIVMDQAVSDLLCDQGSVSLARLGYLTGMLYDPGVPQLATRLLIPKLSLQDRTYRNYLQVALQGTFLLLEGHNPKQILKVLPSYYPSFSPKLVKHSLERALRLDAQFVERTNPHWQKLHTSSVKKLYSQNPRRDLVLNEDPALFMDGYLWAEKWFDQMSTSP
jgi:hypothetical protein